MALRLPIVDQIQANLFTTIQGIVAGPNSVDPQFTLTPEYEDNVEGNVPADLKVIIYRDDEEDEIEQAPVGWEQKTQNFLLVAYSYESQSASKPVEDRASVIGADICRALMVDVTRGSLACDTRIGSPKLAQDRRAIAIPVAVRYQHVYGNPFSQSTAPVITSVGYEAGGDTWTVTFDRAVTVASDNSGLVIAETAAVLQPGTGRNFGLAGYSGLTGAGLAWTFTSGHGIDPEPQSASGATQTI